MLVAIIPAMLASPAEYCNFTKDGRECYLCTKSASFPARQDTVYRASGDCTKPASGTVRLLNGSYLMARGQTILVPKHYDVTIEGQLRVTAPGVTLSNVVVTQQVSVTGRNCSNMVIDALTVTNDTVAVHIAGPRDGLGTIDANNSVIRNARATADAYGEVAVAAIVNANNGPTVFCASSTDLVVRNDPIPQPKGQIRNCRLLALSDVFKLYGAKMELKIMNEEPPEWMKYLDWYNFYASNAALVALIAFFTAKGPKI